MEGYPLERLNDSDTIFLGFQMRQINWLLDTSKHVVPEEECVCPHCGAKGKLHKYNTERVQLTTLPFKERPSKITVIRQCYKCQECGNLCEDAIPGRFEHTDMTHELAEAVISLECSDAGIKAQHATLPSVTASVKNKLLC